MNPISIYVAVGAITFVKCELSYTGIRQQTLTTQKENWKTGLAKDDKGKIENNISASEDLHSNEAWLSQGEDDKEDHNDFVQGWRHFRRIYEQCSEKVNRRLKKVAKTSDKYYSLTKYLSDFRERVLSLYKCVKVYSFRSLDEVIQESYIPLSAHAYFVKDETNTSKNSYGRSTSQIIKPTFRQYAETILVKNWSALVYERLDTLLQSHFLKFQMGTSLKEEGRGRRRDHRMFAMMVMGFMIMVSILIPMGFQFLTVLGGKSLLMAKMALIMSAINGLKKIATSNVGYGFYHTGSDGHHHDHVHHGFHEKLYQNSQPQYGYNV